MKIAIVDDEYYALEGLRIKLSKLEDVELVGMYEDSRTFMDEIVRKNPEVVLLDINMPKKNGIEVAIWMKELGLATMVIFVSAYDNYAERISEIGAVDYIVKPVTMERLEEALAKARESDLGRKGMG